MFAQLKNFIVHNVITDLLLKFGGNPLVKIGGNFTYLRFLKIKRSRILNLKETQNLQSYVHSNGANQ